MLHNFKNTKSKEPQTIQIEPLEHNRVSWVTEVKRRSVNDLYADGKEKLAATFLPADYPESVSKEYLPFTIMSNVSAVSITAMSFLST